MKYGGFPQIFSLNDKDKLKYLNDLFNSILYNDLISRYQIRDVNILEKLIIFLMDNVGKTFSAKSISDYLKQKENVKIAPKTIYNYINYFTNPLLIKKVQRENVEGKEILKIHKKVLCYRSWIQSGFQWQKFNQCFKNHRKHRIH